MDLEVLSLSKQFTKKSLEGVGAIKGAPCTIKETKIDSDGNSIITFEWTDNSGGKHTSELIVNKGQKGDKGEPGDLSNLKVGQNIVLTKNDDGTITISASGELSLDYSKVINKPTINGIELDGNKTSAELGLVDLENIDEAGVDKIKEIIATEDYAKSEDIPIPDGTTIVKNEDGTISAVGGGGTGGHLYQHNLVLNYKEITANVITNSPTPFTVQTLTDWLKNNGFQGRDNMYMASSAFRSDITIIGIFANYSTSSAEYNLTAYYRGTNGSGGNSNLHNTNLVDTVIQLI